MPLKKIIPLLFYLFLISCKKENESLTPSLSAGENHPGVEAFQVKLNADSLKTGESGKWSISKGLIDSKVYFDDSTKSNTIFHGLPGETYLLLWTKSVNDRQTKATVSITFDSLKAVIQNLSPTNQTKFYLNGNIYDKGLWSVQGRYSKLQSTQNGGVVIPDANSPNVQFQGYAYNDYKITWTTYYGSISASKTINLKTGYYLESEALIDLQLAGSPAVGYENNHITSLDLSSSGIAYILNDTLQYPTMQALTYLKSLNLAGSATFAFPSVIGDKYQQLEYLNMGFCSFSSIPDNIGNLSKLKQLIIVEPQDYNTVSSLPDSFGNLTNLEYLDLGELGLQHIPESFSNLVNLTYFNCENNVIQKLPDNIGNLTKLQVLTANSIADMPASITKLTSLRRMYFTTTATNAALPSDFGQLQALDTLILTGPYTSLPTSFANLNVSDLLFYQTPFTSIPDNFGNLKSLTNLQLVGTFKSLPDSFTDLTKLKTLVLGGSLEMLPDQFGKLKNLTYLNYFDGNLKALPSTMGQLTSLTQLYIGGNQVQSLPSGFFDMPNIQTIDLSYNQLTTFPSDFSKLSKTLKDLYITGNSYTAADEAQLKQWLPTTTINGGL